MTEPQKEDTDACMACLDRFMAAVNAHDVTAMEREMHFPHARIAADTVVTYAAPGANPMDLFERLMRNDGWQRSRWISKTIVQGDHRKDHVAVRYAREAAAESVIREYDSHYNTTCRAGRWGVQARSSFGP